jgi:hypothetical protein
VTELSAIPLRREEKMGIVYIEVGTGLVYCRAVDSLISHAVDSLINPVAKITGANPDPSELELRKAVARAVARSDQHAIIDEDIWAALMLEIDERRK